VILALSANVAVVAFAHVLHHKNVYHALVSLFPVKACAVSYTKFCTGIVPFTTLIVSTHVFALNVTLYGFAFHIAYNVILPVVAKFFTLALFARLAVVAVLHVFHHWNVHQVLLKLFAVNVHVWS
jgi:hypothetical protein